MVVKFTLWIGVVLLVAGGGGAGRRIFFTGKVRVAG